MKDRFDQLLDVAAEQEQAELNILFNAKNKTAQAYNNEPTAAHEKNWAAAQRRLEKEVERLWEKYFREEPAFESRTAAAKYLADEGYRVKKSKVFADVQKGLLKVQAGGRVYKDDVDSYILRSGLEKVAKIDPKRIEQTTALKTEKEIEKLDLQVQNLDIEIKQKTGEWIPRDEIRSAWTQRVAEVRSGLMALKHRLPPLLEGKTQQEMREAIDAEIFSLLDNFCRTGKFTPAVKEADA